MDNIPSHTSCSWHCWMKIWYKFGSSIIQSSSERFFPGRVSPFGRCFSWWWLTTSWQSVLNSAGFLYTFHSISHTVIELDDGKIYRKPPYLMVKTHGFRLRFSFKPIHTSTGAQAAKRSWPSYARWWLPRGPECVGPQGDALVVIGGGWLAVHGGCCCWISMASLDAKHFAKGQNFPIWPRKPLSFISWFINPSSHSFYKHNPQFQLYVWIYYQDIPWYTHDTAMICSLSPIKSY